MHRSIILSFLSLSCMLVAGETGSQEEIKGSVTRIIDGDTFFVRSSKSLLRVRLAGIDAPERGQPFASQSHDALKEFLGQKDLLIQKSGVDPKDKKVLVTVEIKGTNVASEMVKEGWAWCVENDSPDAELTKLEKEAREAKRGLWADESPVAPWTYRAQKKEEQAAAPVQTKTPKAKVKSKKKPKEPQPEPGFEDHAMETIE